MTENFSSTPYLDLEAFVQEGGCIITVDIDTQHDFADEKGALYVPAPEGARENMGRLVKASRYRLGSVDSHAFDSWEFKENGGLFPSHCIKGTPGWLRVPETQNSRARFIPMSQGNVVIGEDHQGGGNRGYGSREFTWEVAEEQVEGIFEKEVYSLFCNPNAAPFIEALVEHLGGSRKVLFAVLGYCTGGYCVDGAAEGLRELGYMTAIVEDAVAPIGGEKGAAKTQVMAFEKGIYLVKTQNLLKVMR